MTGGRARARYLGSSGPSRARRYSQTLPGALIFASGAVISEAVMDDLRTRFMALIRNRELEGALPDPAVYYKSRGGY